MATKKSGTNLSLIRGDTMIKKIEFYLRDENGNLILDEDGNPTQYIPCEKDKVRFALKEDYNDKLPLILKEIPTDTMILRLNPSDTKSVLENGNVYVYDIQIEIFEDGQTEGYTDTPISGKFRVYDEVY